MKFTAAPSIVAINSSLSLVSAAPALTDAGIITSTPMEHTLIARKVPEYKIPWYADGICNAAGSCAFDKSDDFPARCKNNGSNGFAPGKEAKCPVNTARYEWEWPWIDHVAQDRWNGYKKCKDNAKALPDKTLDNKKTKKDAFAKCEAL